MSIPPGEVADLGGNDDLVAQALQRDLHQLFRSAEWFAIGISGVEEVYAAVIRCLDRVDGNLVFDAAPLSADAPGSVADGSNRPTGFTQSTLDHFRAPQIRFRKPDVYVRVPWSTCVRPGPD